MTRTVLFFVLCIAAASGKEGFGPGDQDWGFYEVRPGAHTFYWLYHTTASSERPLVIWLQGGPGTSSTGFGNFQEIGLLDINLKERNTSWVNEVNVLFIDNPVGSGFSYVESDDLLVTNNQQIATDLVNFTRQFLEEYPQFRTTPTYIFSESYGGKMAAEFALYLQKETEAGNVQANLKGVALGDSWISPLDSSLSYANFLLNTGLIDYEGFEKINEAAQKMKEDVESERWLEAFHDSNTLMGKVRSESKFVNVYNILCSVPAVIRRAKPTKIIDILRQQPSSCVDGDAQLSELMNGQIKKKLGIPSNLTWMPLNYAVYAALKEDFMKPVTQIVERLLNETSVDVVVYSGQLDLIVDTPGTLSWVQKLKWPGAEDWRNAVHKPLSVHGTLEGYVKSSLNLSFYWIARAGHMVPSDNPYAALELLRQVTHYS